MITKTVKSSTDLRNGSPWLSRYLGPGSERLKLFAVAFSKGAASPEIIATNWMDVTHHVWWSAASGAESASRPVRPGDVWPADRTQRGVLVGTDLFTLTPTAGV